MKERRAYRRTPASRQLEILPVDNSGPRATWLAPTQRPPIPARRNFGHLLDICCGGMGAIFKQPIEVDIACDVRISGPSGKVQTERGRVRTVDDDAEGHRVGIAFDNLVVALGDVKRPGRRLAEDYDIRPLALVIDDDTDVRSTLSKFLTRRGIRVRPAANAHQAIAAIELEAPLLMMLDLRMPEVNGIELLERMRDRDLKVPHIWAMSGYASDADATLAFDLGAAVFFGKPFDLDLLDDSLESLAPAM